MLGFNSGLLFPGADVQLQMWWGLWPRQARWGWGQRAQPYVIWWLHGGWQRFGLGCN